MEKQEISNKLIDAATSDYKKLFALKNLAVKWQQFELAANLRDLEKELFPETDEYRQAHEIAVKVNLVLRMVELSADESTGWLVLEAIKMYIKKNGKFDMEDATELIAKRNKLFIGVDSK